MEEWQIKRGSTPRLTFLNWCKNRFHFKNNEYNEILQDMSDKAPFPKLVAEAPRVKLQTNAKGEMEPNAKEIIDNLAREAEELARNADIS